MITKQDEVHRQRVQAKLDRQRKKVESSPAMRAAREADDKRYIKRGTRCEKMDLSWREKIAQAIEVELSPGVPPEVAAMRNAKCHPCPHSTILRKNELHFCECCGCGQWTFKFPVPGLHDIGADLESKNEHAAHSCPKEDPEFTEYVLERC
jgi:hypothetical protein